MIRVLAKNHSKAVQLLTNKILSLGETCDVLVSSSQRSVSEFLSKSIDSADKALFIVGNVGESAATFAENFSLNMFFDNFAEQNLVEFCKLSQMDLPQPRIREQLCMLPEAFNHFSATYGYQCAAHGVVKQTNVYLLPDEYREVEVVFDNYIQPTVFKRNDEESYVLRVFGLSKEDVESRLSEINPFVLRKYETECLDTKITFSFPVKTSKQVVADTMSQAKQLFAEYIYSTDGKSLPQTIVDLLKKLGKKVSTAESMTGGLIASNIVGVAGASDVLQEGIVCYSIASKCSRLGINPHFIDEFGVVSAEVAQSMAVGLLSNGGDIAVSVTGFAGPSAEPNYPVGLCYISVASTKTGAAVYKNIFHGDRNSIRQQAANMAMFLLYKTFVK